MVSIVGLFFSTSVLRGGSMRTVGYYLLRTVSIVGLYGVYRGFLTYKNTPVSIDENSMHNKKKTGPWPSSPLCPLSLWPQPLPPCLCLLCYQDVSGYNPVYSSFVLPSLLRFSWTLSTSVCCSVALFSFFPLVYSVYVMSSTLFGSVPSCTAVSCVCFLILSLFFCCYWVCTHTVSHFLWGFLCTFHSKCP